MAQPPLLREGGIRLPQPFFSIWTVLPLQEGKFADRHILRGAIASLNVNPAGGGGCALKRADLRRTSERDFQVVFADVRGPRCAAGHPRR